MSFSLSHDWEVAYPSVLFMHLSTSHFWALAWAVGIEHESKVPERDAFGKFANITPWISACEFAEPHSSKNEKYL